MGRTVRELLESLDAAELQEWFAYAAIDPWSEERADLRAGTIAAVVANSHSVKKRYKPSDFMPDFAKAANAKPRQPQDLKAIVQRWNAAMGGTVS